MRTKKGNQFSEGHDEIGLIIRVHRMSFRGEGITQAELIKKHVRPRTS
jgi:hypothetical protein